MKSEYEPHTDAYSERIYYIPKFTKSKNVDVTIEYVTFKVEPKEILKLNFKSLFKK